MRVVNNFLLFLLLIKQQKTTNLLRNISVLKTNVFLSGIGEGGYACAFDSPIGPLASDVFT